MRKSRYLSTAQELDDAIREARFTWSASKQWWHDQPFHDASRGWESRIPPHAVIRSQSWHIEQLERHLKLAQRNLAEETAEHARYRGAVAIVVAAQDETQSGRLWEEP